MKVAVLSDVHDHVWNLRAALSALGDADALVFCGDFCSPFVLGLLADGFPNRPIHAVFGNNDGDLYRITRNAESRPHVRLHGELFAGELDGRRVAANHFPELAQGLARGGGFDLVCYGHDHRFALAEDGGTLTIDPGTLLGFDPVAGHDVPPTFAVYDTLSGTATGYQLSSGGHVAPFP